MINYIVVGAGLAGSVIAERIATQLNKKVLVIEKRNHIGGNCYDYRDENNIIVHKYGPHLFHTNNKEVVDYLSNFTEWQIYNHEVLAFIDGKKVPLPFNLNTLYELLPETKARKLEEKLLSKFGYGSRVPILKLKKTEDSDLKFLANFIYKKVFLNYTIKQWGIKPEEIDEKVTARVPVVIGKDNRYFSDKYQMVPKKGYTEMIKNMLSHRNIKLMLNTDFKEICQIKGTDFYILGTKFEGKIIYTGPIDELFDHKFGELPYRSIKMEFQTLDHEFFQEKATVNYPNDYDFTRITEFKHIHPVKTERTTILKEYPESYRRGKNEPYYPIFTNENLRKYEKNVECAKQFHNLVLVGRLAEYRYYDMDDVVARALEVFKEKVKWQ